MELIQSIKRHDRLSDIIDMIDNMDDVNVTYMKDTPLLIAIRYKYYETYNSIIVKKLIEKGADVNYDYDGRSNMLIESIITYSTPCIAAALIEAGANLNVTCFGHTPLSAAIEYDRSILDLIKKNM